MPNIDIIKAGDNIAVPSAHIRVFQGASLRTKIQNVKHSFRAAHCTDWHAMDTTICNARIAAFQASLAAQTYDIVLNGGDCVDQNPAQLPQYNSLISGITKPMLVARGNHDYAVTNAQIGMPTDNYYYQDFGSKWRIIVLHSQGGGNYSLGATQMAWLTDLLTASVGKNVCILSHVPIVSVAAYMWYMNHTPQQNWTWSTDSHSDANALIALFLQHPNVKVCISGHEHTIDRVEHLGVVYMCSGAVCGNWWRDTTYTEAMFYHAGYRMIDFYDDGSVEEQFIIY